MAQSAAAALLLVAGAAGLALAFKGSGDAKPHATGLIPAKDAGPGGITKEQADAIAPAGPSGVRMFTDEAKLALWRSLAPIGAAQVASSLDDTQVFHLEAAPNSAQEVASYGNMTQGRTLLMPIANALGGSVPYMRLVAAGTLPAGLAIATGLNGYAVVAMPGETAVLKVKAGIPGDGEAIPPLPAPPTPIGEALPPLPGPDVFGLAPGALLPGDPYGVLAALGPTPGLDALGAAGAHLKRQIANAVDPTILRTAASTYDAAGNPAVGAELRNAAAIVQALHDATAKSAEWAGIKALPSPYVGRGLNLVQPLDYAALDDGSKPLCPGVPTVDLPAMIAAVWAGKPWPTNPDGSTYSDAQMVPWLLGLTRGDGSKVFPDGPIMTTAPNPLCPDAAQVQDFQNALAAIGLVGPWNVELTKIAARLLLPLFPLSP